MERKTENVNTDEDPSGWRPCLTFVEMLKEKCSKNEPGTLYIPLFCSRVNYQTAYLALGENCKKHNGPNLNQILTKKT